MSGYFLPAPKVKVNERHAVFASLPRESLVELHGLPADEVNSRTLGKSAGHREVGYQVHDDQRGCLTPQPAKDVLQVLLVPGDGYTTGNIVRPDRECDDVRLKGDASLRDSDARWL